MNTDIGAANITEGMDVFGSAGDKIGTVSHVWSDADQDGAGMDTTPVTGDVIVEEVDIVSAGSETATDSITADAIGEAYTSSTGTATATPTGYFQVDQGGILGIGATQLYIPISAIADIDPGNALTLNCTKDEADAEYAEKPASLS